MGFGKTMLAVICADLIFATVKTGLEEIDKRLHRNRERHTGFGDYESIYSGKKHSDKPYARKIGFGEND